MGTGCTMYKFQILSKAWCSNSHTNTCTLKDFSVFLVLGGGVRWWFLKQTINIQGWGTRTIKVWFAKERTWTETKSMCPVSQWFVWNTAGERINVEVWCHPDIILVMMTDTSEEHSDDMMLFSYTLLEVGKANWIKFPGKIKSIIKVPMIG